MKKTKKKQMKEIEYNSEYLQSMRNKLSAKNKIMVSKRLLDKAGEIFNMALNDYRGALFDEVRERMDRGEKVNINKEVNEVWNKEEKVKKSITHQ